jgi:hypothetical protein
MILSGVAVGDGRMVENEKISRAKMDYPVHSTFPAIPNAFIHQ